jgi:hypothetical protein
VLRYDDRKWSLHLVKIFAEDPEEICAGDEDNSIEASSGHYSMEGSEHERGNPFDHP